MPVGNQFRHQSYPTQPATPPVLHTLQTTPPIPGSASELHTELAVDQVILVHGTFLGDDPFGISATLQALAQDSPGLASAALNGTAELLLRTTRPILSRSVRDLGNYTADFRDTFQALVGDDPQVELLQPTWSSENHHFAGRPRRATPSQTPAESTSTRTPHTAVGTLPRRKRLRTALKSAGRRTSRAAVLPRRWPPK